MWRARPPHLNERAAILRHLVYAPYKVRLRGIEVLRRLLPSGLGETRKPCSICTPES